MSFDKSTIAHRIPPELFERILLRLEPHELQASRKWTAWSEEEETKKQLKRYLGQCSLVCQYWAKHSRSRIFENIILRTPEDAIRLLEFTKVTTAGMNIGMYVLGFDLHVTLGSPPWVHLAVNAIPSFAFPKMRGFMLVISGGAVNTEASDDPKSLQVAPRNISYGLPRSLPPTKRPVSLTLSDTRFNTFDDLVSFVDSLMATKPALRTGQTTFNRISWLDSGSLSPDAVPRAFNGARRCWRKLFPTVSVSGCTAVWPFLWLVITTERPGKTRNQSPLYVDGAETCRLAGLVQTVLDDCRCAACGGLASPQTLLADRQPIKGLRGSSVQVSGGTHELTFSLSDGLVTGIDLALIAPYAEQIPRDEPPEAFGFNWAVLDMQVAAFNATMGTFRVHIPDAMYAAYEPFVCAHLPATGASGKLKVERQGGKSGEKSGKAE